MNVVAGCLFSPITSITKLTIAGVHPDSESQVKEDMERLVGIPYALLHRGWVENRLLMDGSGESLAWKGNIFGRASLTVIPRSASANLVGKGLAGDLAIDSEGSIFRAASVSSRLPRMTVPSRATEATGMLLSGWEAATAGAFSSALCKEVGGDLSGLIIHVSEDSSFSLELGGKWLELGALASVDEGVELAKSMIESSTQETGSPSASEEKDQSAPSQAVTDQTVNDPSNITDGTTGTNPPSSTHKND